MSGVSWAWAPPRRINPSGPRMTDGSKGSDSCACRRDEGSREMLVAVSVLPSSGAVGEDSLSTGATTVVVSVARASERTIREASSRPTRTGSNPSSDTATVAPGKRGFDNEASVGACHKGRHEDQAVEDLDGRAGKRQTGLIDDDSPHRLRGRQFRRRQDDGSQRNDSEEPAQPLSSPSRDFSREYSGNTSTIPVRL